MKGLSHIFLIGFCLLDDLGELLGSLDHLLGNSLFLCGFHKCNSGLNLHKAQTQLTVACCFFGDAFWLGNELLASLHAFSLGLARCVVFFYGKRVACCLGEIAFSCGLWANRGWLAGLRAPVFLGPLREAV